MRVFGPPPVKDWNFTFIFCIYDCLFSLHLKRTSGPSSTKPFLLLPCIRHICVHGLALTSHVVKSVHRNTHTHTLLTSIREPTQFACLCRTISQAFAAIYPTHVLVCLRAFFYIHTTWMTFGPLSIISTWGTACATISLPHWSFI